MITYRFIESIYYEMKTWKKTVFVLIIGSPVFIAVIFLDLLLLPFTLIGYIGSGTQSISNKVEKAYKSPGDYAYKFDRFSQSIIEYRGNETEIDIPEMIDGIPVLRIGVNAFKYHRIAKLTLPSTLTEVSSFAFSNNSIVELNIPGNLQYIGIYAFAENQISKLTLNEGVIRVDTGAFNNNILEVINFPDSIKVIGDKSFSKNKIHTIAFNENLNTIGDEAFAFNEIESIVIPESVMRIGDNAFSHNQINKIIVKGKLDRFGKYGLLLAGLNEDIISTHIGK